MRWKAGAERSLLAFLLLGFCFLAEGQTTREPQLKAVYLFNFAQFTEWPVSAFPDKEAPFVIGILGTDPFGHYLDDTVNNETIRDRKVLVERYRRLEDLKTCHILYIGQSEALRLDEIVRALKGKPVLTVSDIASATNHGIMVRFFTDRNRLRFRVNLQATKGAELTVSSKLLRLAEISGHE